MARKKVDLDRQPAEKAEIVLHRNSEDVPGASYIWYPRSGQSLVVTEYADGVTTCHIDKRYK